MSTEIKKILFPTDLTKHARYAFNVAAGIASHFGATIAILHVMRDLPQRVEADLKEVLGDDKYEDFLKQKEDDTREVLIGKKRDGMMIRQALSTFCEDFSPDDPNCSVATDEIIVKTGRVVEDIINQADVSGCDMIVMAYHSRNMLAEAMVGGVTRRVLRRSKKPVLLVPMPEDE